MRPTPDKLQAVKEAPTPKNVSQLRLFLGLVNYYQKFIHNLFTMLYPLNCLLKLGAKWHWTKECEKAFDSAKLALMSEKLLVHYDPDLPLQLAGDASEYGIGAIISHVFPDGNEKPIAFASRTLTSSERNYAQLEEALSLVFGVRKFYQYLYGCSFVLYTDQKHIWIKSWNSPFGSC